MAFSDTDAQKRTAAIANVNEAMAGLEIAQKRIEETKAKHAKLLNDAKADVGTAETNLAMVQEKYAAARARLIQLLPDPS